MWIDAINKMGEGMTNPVSQPQRGIPMTPQQPQQELCSNCDEPTGRSGKDSDSLFVTLLDDGIEYGPLCEECYQMYESERLNLSRWSIL